MQKDTEIALHLDNAGQALLRPNSPNYCKRILDEDLEEYIIEEAKLQESRGPVTIRIFLPAAELSDGEKLIPAIQQHFTYRKSHAKEQIKHWLKLGWKNLFVGVLFLGIIFLLAELGKNFFPESSIMKTVHESLLIIGWVALWRPADLLLYEWRPYKRKADLYERLEKSKVLLMAQQP